MSKMTPREERGLAQEHAACKNRKGCSQRVQSTMGSPLRSEGSPGEGPRPLGPHSPQRFCLLHPCQASRARTPPADTRSASWRPHAWLVGRQATLQAGGTLAPTLKAQEVCGHTGQPCSPSQLCVHQLHAGKAPLCAPGSPPAQPGLPLTFDGGQVGPEVLLQAGALGLQRERQGEGGAWSTAHTCPLHPVDTCHGWAVHCKASGAYGDQIGKHPGFGVRRLLPLWPQTHTELPPWEPRS